MVRDEQKYQQALQFRSRGFTLVEIAKICGVSKGTVSKWLKNNTISASVTKQNKHRAGKENAKRLQLMAKARGKERAVKYLEVEHGADIEYRHYKSSPRFIAGISTYSSIGDLDKNGTIRLSSSRMNIHRTFILFALEYLGVPKSKVRFWLLLYPSHNEMTCMKKWQKNIAIPYAQFHTSQILKDIPKRETLHHGVGNTIIGSTVLKRKLLRWIQLMQKDGL